MMKTVCLNTLPFDNQRKVMARFDGGNLTSDAGLMLVASLDRQHQLCEGFSSLHYREPGPTLHST